MMGVRDALYSTHPTLEAARAAYADARRRQIVRRYPIVNPNQVVYDLTETDE